MHEMIEPLVRRRQMLKLGGATGLLYCFTPGLFAEELMRTAQMGEGPFYPDRLPLDTDNDLLIVNDSLTPAVGEITHLTGKIFSASGSPVRNAFVEIWQVDGNGYYIHSGSGDSEVRDGNFQGYGRFLTGTSGEYYFRTIKPIGYGTGNFHRTPHIHFAVSKNGQRIFTSQMLIQGEPGNERDGLFRRVSDPGERDTILAEFKPIPESKIGELAAHFDIVLGHTVEEMEDGTLRGGIGKSQRQPRRG